VGDGLGEIGQKDGAVTKAGGSERGENCHDEQGAADATDFVLKFGECCFKDFRLK